MDFDLAPSHLELQRNVREFCERELMPRSQEFDAKETFHWDAVPGLRRLGLLGITFPKKYGGQELDHVSLVVILEELGRADAAVALTVESHNGLCTNHLYLHGSEAQRQKYLPRLATGEQLGAWALTEPQAGSDAQSLKTRAIRDGSHWVISGSKTFTTQGSVAGIYVVFAQTSAKDNPAGRDGLTAFVMEKGTPGLNIGKIEHKMGIRSSDTAQLHLQGVRLSDEHVVGTPGRAFRDAMVILDGGRVAISGVAVGIARGALEEGLKWVKSRPESFGVRPDNAGLTAAGRLLAQLAADVDAARLLALRSAWLMDRRRPYSREASMAKLVSGDLAMRAPTEILDLFGPDGALMSNPVQRYFRDAKLYQIGEGSSQIQQLILSRQMFFEGQPKPERKKEAAHA